MQTKTFLKVNQYSTQIYKQSDLSKIFRLIGISSPVTKPLVWCSTFFFYRAKVPNFLHVMTKIYCLFIEANLLFISTNSKYDKCLQEAQPTRNGFMLRYIERTHWRLSFSHTVHRSTAVPNRRRSGSIQKPQAEAVTCCPLYSHPFPDSEVSR